MVSVFTAGYLPFNGHQLIVYTTSSSGCFVEMVLQLVEHSASHWTL